MNNAKKESIITRNYEKMGYMAEHYGMDYFIMLGELTIDKYNIQEAIDICWNHFKKIENYDKTN